MRGMSWCERVPSRCLCVFVLVLFLVLSSVESESIPPLLHQLKRVRESEKQCKPLLDKNKLLNKRNDDLTQTIQKMEEKLKGLAKENLEMVGTCITHVLISYRPPADVGVTFLCACVAEGEDQLSSTAEEAEVFEWPGSGTWRAGNRLSEASGPGAAKHHRRPDQSNSFIPHNQLLPPYSSLCSWRSRSTNTVCYTGQTVHNQLKNTFCSNVKHSVWAKEVDPRICSVPVTDVICVYLI